jgi:alpha/beta superfamily hydrolase
MRHTSITIRTGSEQLEARLREPEEIRGAALLCHPHPLHGGDMNNRVIFRAARASDSVNFASLRFNFRGVGRSSGCYDGGAGEGEDVVAVIEWLANRYPRMPQVLIGFSFGAWVGLGVACRDSRVSAMVGLGIPLNEYDFGFLLNNHKPTLILVGTDDEFCSQERLESLARGLPPQTAVHAIEEADHFFPRHLDQVQDLLTRSLQGWNLQSRRT